MAQTKLKWAHVYETSEPYHRWSVWAGEEIKKRTNGKYEVQVFPASSLGKETDINQGLQLGTIEARVRTLATELGSTVSGSYDPAVVGMPTGEFYDGDHLLEPGIQRLLAPIRQKLVTAPAL